MTSSKFLSVLGSLFAMALAAAPCHSQEKEDAKDKPAMSAVVQVDGEYRIITKEALATLKDELKNQHKAALEEHKKAAAEAKKNKEKFTTPAPKASKMKVIKPSISATEAEKLVAELRAKDDKKKAPAKKEPKKEKPKKEKPKK